MFEILSTCNSGGYVYCRTKPYHPKANAKGLYPMHRVVMENKLGRLLNADEDVHHKDENKTNNDPDNLEVLSKSEHTKKHVTKVGNVKLTCPKCGIAFELAPRFYRLRLKRSKRGIIFCSLACSQA